jgi:tripartite-type tricarboxylate transporter receptor subunit TctC
MPVINMPGVGGTVGLREASRRAADGYTISQVHEGLLVATETGITELAWDDFDPIALMTASPQYLVAGPSENYSNFEEFVNYAHANPGEISIGVTLGGVPHLHAAMIEQAFDLQLNYVGYEGTGERVRAMVGGNLDVAIGDISSSKQFVDNGDLVFLAVGSLERVADTPDVPTFSELGQELDLSVTRGIVMPKGAPQEIRDTLEAALEALSQDSTYIEQTNNAGADVSFRGQDAYTAYLGNLDATVKSLSAVLAP